MRAAASNAASHNSGRISHGFVSMKASGETSPARTLAIVVGGACRRLWRTDIARWLYSHMIVGLSVTRGYPASMHRETIRLKVTRSNSAARSPTSGSSHARTLARASSNLSVAVAMTLTLFIRH